jgi:hypothetical protein
MWDLKFLVKLYWKYVGFEVFRQIILELLWNSMFLDKLHWNYVEFEVFRLIILELCGIWSF